MLPWTTIWLWLSHPITSLLIRSFTLTNLAKYFRLIYTTPSEHTQLTSLHCNSTGSSKTTTTKESSNFYENSSTTKTSTSTKSQRSKLSLSSCSWNTKSICSNSSCQFSFFRFYVSSSFGSSNKNSCRFLKMRTVLHY